MKNTIILLILSIQAILTQAQVFDITWQNCFGGTYQDEAYDIIQAEDGYLIIGATQSIDGDVSYNHGGDDVWIIKIDTMGNFIWEKCLGGSYGDGGSRILNTTNGNFYILAGAYSSDGDITYDPYPNSSDFWIIKINPEGGIIWDKIVGSSKLNHMSSGVATDDGGVVAIGWSSTNDGDMTEWYGYYDMWMIKLDSTGLVEWDFTLGGSDFDIGYDIIQTNDGGFLVAGSAVVKPGGNLECDLHGQADAMLIKLDSARNIEWQKCYGGSDYDGATRVMEINNGQQACQTIQRLHEWILALGPTGSQPAMGFVCR
ncbi:MAG: hypothetical protein U5Q03_16920 [Bacteroidota bacterium]|nr:hypothetical protein [Bacteroidota bacterium]